MSFIQGNPLLDDEIFQGDVVYGETMTVKGTVQKTFILFMLLIIPAAMVWNLGPNSALLQPIMITGLIGGMIFALIGIFSKKNARFAAPVYAVFEGLFLGAVSLYYNSMFYEGIVSQAVVLTFGILLTMIGLYSGRIIRATNTFVKVVTVATVGVCMAYFISFIMSFFGTTLPYIHQSGTIGIGFSLFVVVLAALNFVIDFDQIEKGERQAAPKYMEWFGALSVMITLVWLYINILRLLSKLASRD